LTAKQLSFRLPVHVAAKLLALGDMFPHKTRTQLVGDLLATALTDLEQSFPSEREEREDMHPETKERIYEDVGPVRQYQELANRYYKSLEAELGNKHAPPLFVGSVWFTAKDEND
jgi:hypothetical protein